MKMEAEDRPKIKRTGPGEKKVLGELEMPQDSKSLLFLAGRVVGG